MTQWLLPTTVFAILALSAGRIGQFAARLRLPRITGFLIAGILVGPYVLDLIHQQDIPRLLYIDEAALGFIAFAAGTELYLRELRSRLKSITWVTAGVVLATFTLGTTAVWLLADAIPFTQGMPPPARLAVAILAGALLGAISPSSVIAIINELRARGPFTATVLGVTVIMDVLVIILFAIGVSVADVLLTGMPFGVESLILLLGELAATFASGYVLYWLLRLVLSRRMGGLLKAAAIILLGYSVFVYSHELRRFSHELLPFEVLLEPLLICLIAGILITNNSPHHHEFRDILEKAGPPVYIAFFMLVGASLRLDVLTHTWQIALVLFGVRLVALAAGSIVGGTIAGDPFTLNRIKWMGLVTQAGVVLGLAQEVSVEFPDWGASFATIIVSLVVLNQTFGPPLFKWAIHAVGEGREQAEAAPFDGVRDALIFGVDGQSLSLARQLRSHGWQVRVVCRQNQTWLEQDTDLPVVSVEQLTPAILADLGAANAEAIVAMLSDEENYAICEIAYEHFGTRRLIARLTSRANLARFHQLGVLIVEPGTAILNLLEHFVRSPGAASLLMGMADGQDVIDVEVRNPDIHGLRLRDLRLPGDTLILSVRRGGQTLISHGYTQLMLGDEVTIVGSPQSLEAVTLRMDAIDLPGSSSLPGR